MIELLNTEAHNYQYITYIYIYPQLSTCTSFSWEKRASF